ncbi:MAG: DUF1343 domain-containing protein [Planctomycetaceae bacterium]|nr:DUF1343 domain-containing protein [Planctomycetaceae bacterium]
METQSEFGTCRHLRQNDTRIIWSRHVVSLVGLTLIEVLRRDYGEQWERGRLNTLMLHRKALGMIESGQTAAEIDALWKEELDTFLQRRERYLIYR